MTKMWNIIKKEQALIYFIVAISAMVNLMHSLYYTWGNPLFENSTFEYYGVYLLMYGAIAIIFYFLAINALKKDNTTSCEKFASNYSAHYILSSLFAIALFYLILISIESICLHQKSDSTLTFVFILLLTVMYMIFIYNPKNIFFRFCKKCDDKSQKIHKENSEIDIENIFTTIVVSVSTFIYSVIFLFDWIDVCSKIVYVAGSIFTLITLIGIYKFWITEVWKNKIKSNFSIIIVTTIVFIVVGFFIEKIVLPSNISNNSNKCFISIENNK